jgi:hypothetical protein
MDDELVLAFVPSRIVRSKQNLTALGLDGEGYIHLKVGADPMIQGLYRPSASTSNLEMLAHGPPLQEGPRV